MVGCCGRQRTVTPRQLGVRSPVSPSPSGCIARQWGLFTSPLISQAVWMIVPAEMAAARSTQAGSMAAGKRQGLDGSRAIGSSITEATPKRFRVCTKAQFGGRGWQKGSVASRGVQSRYTCTDGDCAFQHRPLADHRLVVNRNRHYDPEAVEQAWYCTTFRPKRRLATYSSSLDLR